MAVAAFVCGVSKRDAKGKIICPCCKKSYEDEQMLMNFCGACSFSDNFDCENCLEAGVGVSFFQRNGKYHRFVGWDSKRKVKLDRTCLTACGLKIPYKDAGGGSAVLEWCKKCWREDERENN